MRVRITDNEGDWTFGQSELNYAKQQKAIEFDIIQKLREWWQDCFFALENGIAWSIRLGSHNQKELLDSDIQETITSVDGVLEILSFNSIVNERRYRAEVQIYTIFSETPLDLVFDSKGII